MQITEILTCI